MNKDKNLSLSTLELNPSEQAVASLIWLHGLGATNEDFLPVAAELESLTGLALRFVFPQAPLRPVTINNGYVMPAWYDVASFDRNGSVDQQGIETSVQQMQGLIEQELQKGFASKQIILAGFSQGAVIALSTLLAHPQALGGVIALSGYLPKPPPSPAPTTAPIFMAHGLEDNIVPATFGEQAYEALKNANYAVSWHSYAMPHSVCEDEIRDLGQWLLQHLR